MPSPVFPAVRGRTARRKDIKYSVYPCNACETHSSNVSSGGSLWYRAMYYVVYKVVGWDGPFGRGVERWAGLACLIHWLANLTLGFGVFI